MGEESVSMKHLQKTVTMVLVVLLAAASFNLSGCFGIGKQGSLTLPAATIAPPEINSSGVLTVGVDPAHAPFAGSSGGKTIGMDVDIAAAIAEKLGLRLSIVPVQSGEDVSSKLKNHEIDLYMGLQTDATSTYSEAQVGPYLVDGPAVFMIDVSGDMPFDPNQLVGVQIAAQEKSLSAWQVGKDYGEANVLSLATLEEVFNQLNSGAVSYAAADAVVGSFLAMDYKNIRCKSILGSAKGVYMGVAKDRAELASRLTEVLKTLRDDGSLEVIIAKWLGSYAAALVSNNSSIEKVTSAGDSAVGDVGVDPNSVQGNGGAGDAGGTEGGTGGDGEGDGAGEGGAGGV
jgi:polar amino acid transport system substrate-binding protein